MNLHRLYRSPRSPIGLSAVLLGAVALGVYWGAVWRASPTPPTFTRDLAPPDALPASALSPELARIFAEPNEVLREHRLANWVAEHTLDEIVEHLRGLSEDQRQPVATLATLKIRDMDHRPLGSPQARHLVRQHAALYRDNPSAFIATSLADSLLEQADTDPLGAFHKLASLRIPSKDRENVQERILANLSRKDPHQALALLDQMRGLPRGSALGIIAENWTRFDPTSAFAWARQQPRASHTLHVVLREWSRLDPSAALEAATALPAAQAAQVGMKDLLGAWLRESPAESVAWLKTVPHPDPQLITATVEALGKSHPQVVQTLLARPMSAPLRTELTASFANEWAKTDPTAVARWAETLPKDEAYHRVMSAVFSRLSETDPRAALALYRSLPEGSPLRGVAYDIAPRLPAHDALTWLLSLPSSDRIDNALGQTLYRPEFSSATQLQAALAKIPPGPALNPASSIATRRQFSDNPAGLTDWLRTLPTAEARTEALRTVGKDWAEKSLADARAYARELGSGPSFDALVPGLHASMAATDPSAATDWLLSLPPSVTTRRQIDDAFKELARKTPSVAIDKLRALPAGDTRSAAFEGLISTLPPQQKTEPLFQIGTPAEQLALIKTIARQSWFDTPSDASAWLQTLPAGPVRDAALPGSAERLAIRNPAAPLSLLPLATSDETRYAIAREALLALHFNDEAAARTTLERLPLPPPPSPASAKPSPTKKPICHLLSDKLAFPVSRPSLVIGHWSFVIPRPAAAACLPAPGRIAWRTHV